ncbi:MAG: PDZ domain-containing protein [Gemmatimonadaceae bacterium]|nr:PDZ domain-containing protein [Gemmatimonadaceae bacterium]
MSMPRSSTRRIVYSLAGVATVCSAFALGMWHGASRARNSDAWVDGRLISTAIDSVRLNALDSLPSEELVKRAVSGMLRELKDPYAAMLRPEGFKSYRGTLMGESDGLGMALRLQGNTMSVRRVMPGSPAALAGIRRGDRVLSWNGRASTDRSLLSGEDTAKASTDRTRLMLRRLPTGEPLAITVRRTLWHAPAVTESGLLGDAVGYVRIASITQHAADEVERAVDGMIRQGARSFVLDLRGNGGGLFEEGVKIAGLFLPKQALVASLVGRRDADPQAYRVSHSRWPNLPLAVLVDPGTASASEVIAAALREHGRTVLVGAPTYGKGVVQRVVRLSSDISLRLTTARWTTPTGRALERREAAGEPPHGGLQPDVRVRDARLRDPSAIPRAWTSAVAERAIAVADSAVVHAIAEQWPRSAVGALEQQVRDFLAMHIGAKRRVAGIDRDAWLDVTTRLATVRLLELDGATAPLLEYTMRLDETLRLGHTVLSKK